MDQNFPRDQPHVRPILSPDFADLHRFGEPLFTHFETATGRHGVFVRSPTFEMHTRRRRARGLVFCSRLPTSDILHSFHVPRIVSRSRWHTIGTNTKFPSARMSRSESSGKNSPMEKVAPVCCLAGQYNGSRDASDVWRACSTRECRWKRERPNHSPPSAGGPTNRVGL